MKPSRLLLLCLVYLAFASCKSQSGNSGASGAPTNIPASASDAAALANPTNPTPMNAASVAQGHDIYHKADCALCHGKLGDGQGFEARDAHLNVHDWRDPAYSSKFTDSQFYAVMLKGKGLMPAYETRNTPEQIWLMVDYIRSMSAQSAK